MNINEWAEADRPRERLISHGAEVLSDAELLAILIGSGNNEETAVDLMRRILSEHGDSLRNLGRLHLEDFTRYKGMGPAKAVTVMAAMELARRRNSEPEEEWFRIKDSSDLARYFRPRLQDLTWEECHVMLLRQNLTVMETYMLSRGGITESAVDIRLVLQKALLAGAPVVVLCHNHPSGNLRPSQPDEELTKRLNNACRMMGLRLLDHVIVSCNGYYSFAEHGLL